jgi:hypothetical protein
MKPRIAVVLLSLFLLYFDTAAQSPRLRQVKTNPVIQRPASRKAVATFVAFLKYVKNGRPDIVQDINAQERFLSRSLRKAMMDSNTRWVEYLKKHPEDKPDGPSNESFTGVWNQPTTYSIVSARQYDYRDEKNPNALRTIIDVLYVWGNEDDINNQYPGVRNLHTFILIFEDGTWKLDDIYIYSDEFASSESLWQYFTTDRP